MIESAPLREWRNQAVVDEEDHKIGVLEGIYVDTATDRPAMATVRCGLPTRNRLLFVLVAEAIVGPGYVKVPYPRALVRKAPPIGTDDVLPAGQEPEIFQYYGLVYQPGMSGERQLARR
ncbi:PRC-barrel domain-containing protein [Streptomyces sp. NPDC059070]|uniref:PRC-barrel domain-containing protein n=1 Tax=unclassified Streptomyces TaxID=2593676 RepID=UPI0034E19D61